MDRRAFLRATASLTAGGLAAGCAERSERDAGEGGSDGNGADGSGGSGGAGTDGGRDGGGSTSTRAPTMTPPEDGTTRPGPDETVSTVPPVTPTTTTAAVPITDDPDAVVTIRDSTFEPRRLSIDPGDEVRWVNGDGVDHAVESVRFHDSAVEWGHGTLVPAGEDTQMGFDDPGIYEYGCSLHGAETGCGVVLVGDVSLEKRLPCK